MWNTTQLTDSLKSFYTQSLEQAEQLGGKLGERANELTERFDVREHADRLTEKIGLRQNAAALAERVSQKLPPENKIVIASKKVLDWAEAQTARSAGDQDEASASATKKPAKPGKGQKDTGKKPATKKASATKSSSAKKASASNGRKKTVKTDAEVSQIVAADGDTWVVKRSDSEHVTYRTESKEAAVARASRIAQNNGRKLVVIESADAEK